MFALLFERKMSKSTSTAQERKLIQIFTLWSLKVRTVRSRKVRTFDSRTAVHFMHGVLKRGLLGLFKSKFFNWIAQRSFGEDNYTRQFEGNYERFQDTWA